MMTKTISFVLVLCFLGGISFAEPITQERLKQKVFSTSYDQVWKALEETIVQDLHMQIRTNDKENGTIETYTFEFDETKEYTEKIILKEKNTKRVYKTGNYRSVVSVTKNSDGTITVKPVFNISLWKPLNPGGEYLVVESSGYLEDELLTKLSKKLTVSNK